PGTPVLWYGEEIGMGDCLELPERDPVRTPMQWSARPGGGFSEADPASFPRPVVSDEPFGYEHVNVEAQRCDPDSFLGWMEHALRVRREHPAFGRGEWRIVDSRHEAVFAHACEWRGDVVLAVHNLSAEEATAALDLSPWTCHHAVDLLEIGCRTYPVRRKAFNLALEPYGFRWFRLVES